MTVSIPLTEDHRGFYCYTGRKPLDRKTFDWMAARIGRVDGPALLFDLYFKGQLDLARADMAGVVADVWSRAEYPQKAFHETRLWLTLFRANGYSDDGRRVQPPNRPIPLYRGCTEAGRFGMSWSSSASIASQFAFDNLRDRPTGRVYTTTVAPEHLLAYIHQRGRSEFEYVIDPFSFTDANIVVRPNP